jgi:osmoprotectant transport system permease protein
VGNFFDYWSDPSRQSQLVELTIDHIVFVIVAMIAAIAIAVTLGVIAHRIPATRNFILSMSAVFLTIPSLALFALLIPIMGIGAPPVYVALVMYAQLAIVRNTVSGLNSVPAPVSESAKGMGMGYWQRLFRIEMPMAWPVILAGIRVSTQLTVGIACIAAVIGADNLGTLIFGGIRRLGSAGSSESIIGGTIAVVILAFAFDLLFMFIGRLTTSRGIRA